MCLSLLADKHPICLPLEGSGSHASDAKHRRLPGLDIVEISNAGVNLAGFLECPIERLELAGRARLIDCVVHGRDSGKRAFNHGSKHAGSDVKKVKHVAIRDDPSLAKRPRAAAASKMRAS
jgi:hypothetical protein